MKLPQAGRHRESGSGAGGGFIPVSASQPRPIASARFSIIPSSSRLLGRDIGGIMREGQFLTARQRPQNGGGNGAAAKAEPALGPRRIVNALDRRGQRPAARGIE